MTNTPTRGYRLSPQQKQVWLNEKASTGFRAQCALHLNGDLNPEALKAALEKVIQRHEILRTTFLRPSGINIPFQVVGDPWTPSWSIVDLSDVKVEAQERRVEEILYADESQPFDFEHIPLLRLVLITLSADKHILLLSLPSLCADTRSLKNLVDEICGSYSAYFEGDRPSEEVLQYADFSEWQNELLESEDETAKLGRDFWKKQEEELSRLPPLTLPFESSPTDQTVFSPAVFNFELGPSTVANVKASARKNNTSVSTFLLACWQTLLWRLSNHEKISVNVVHDGRKYQELQKVLGLFARSLPISCSFEDNPGFSNVLKRIEEEIDRANEWQEYFAGRQSTLTNGPPLDHAIAFEFEEQLPGRQAAAVWFSVANIRSLHERYKLKLSCLAAEESLLAEFIYDPFRLQKETLQRIAAYFEVIVKSACEEPHTRADQLEILPEAERRQLLVEFNETKSDYPDAKCIQELFEEQVSKTPDHTAVVFQGQRLSYAELNARANQLAHFLLQRGVGPGANVGLCVDRSLEMIVGLLGTLKAGGTYVPLNPEHPKARLSNQLGEIQARVLLTQEKHVSQLPDFAGEIVCLDRDHAVLASQPTINPETTTTPGQIVYLIYTSGSTGTPKGVAVKHQSLVNYTHFICTRLNLNRSQGGSPGLQFASVSTINADLGNTCIFPSLISGGCLHILDYEVATDGDRFASYVLEHRIDVLKIVPSHLRSLMDATRERNILPMKYLILGGETLTWELVKRIRAMNNACDVMNHYGPTETTVGSLTLKLKENTDLAKTSASVPIGRPIANTEIFILDQLLNPVPLGVSGQLYIGGVGLAQNYLNQPEQTAERFIANPFSRNGATRLYKTGDLARYLADGNIEFLGRADNQVKIRGYRVELGEIEATLDRLEGVRQVVVVAKELGPEDKELVAYVVPALDQAPTTSELRSSLRETLPEYMIPTSFVFLRELPLTRNGKIDRAVLPTPDHARTDLQQSFVGPTSPTEELVAGIWAKLLKLERVGIHDNFFELGGHSLLATQVISRLRQTFQIELPLSSLFEAPTVSGMAQQIETIRLTFPPVIAPPIQPVSRGGQEPLSFAQQRLWLLDQLQPGSYTYNVSRAVRVKGPLKYQALKQALDTLVARHESLRTTFTAADGLPMQVIAEDGSMPLRMISLSDLPEATRQEQGDKLIHEEAQQPFDLARGPLMRATLIQLDNENHILVLNNHHIVSDGWSAGILFQELALLYKAFSLGQLPQLPELPIHYTDYAVWQREWLQGEVLEQEVSYWKQQLAGAPVLLELPTDGPRPAVQTHKGARERIVVPNEMVQAIKTLSQREGVTLFMILLATFQLLLSRYSGQDDIVVGSPIAGRTRAEIERVIGFFLNTLVLRTRLSGDPTFRDLLMRVRDVALGAYAHQHLPFERLIEELQPPRSLSHTPLFQVFLNVLNFSPIEVDLPGLTIEELPTPDIGSKFDLTLYAVEQKDGMTLELLYNSDLFGPDRIVEMLKQFEFLLAQIVKNPDEKISSLSLVTPGSKQLLPDPRQALSGTSRPPIHRLFSEQARRDPNQLAIVDPNESWTYHELDYRSNQLANYLLASGIKSGNTVAIYGHRSAPLVWAVMGVLKAGAAFIILDPAYPVSRLISCLQMAQPRAWLQIKAAGTLPNRLDEFLNTLSCCCRLELPASENNRTLLSQYPGNDPQVKVDSDDLALVAFTSGSTGTPKGILGRHGSLTLFAAWTQDMFGLNQSERFSMLSGLSHDPLQRDIFTPLQLGATISIPDPEDLADPLKLVRWFNEQKISVANLTPAMAQLLCETTWTTSPSQIRSLRYSFLIGDILTKHDVSRLKVLAPSVTCVNLYGSTETQRALSYFIVPPLPARLPAVDGRRPLQKEVLPLGRGIEEVELLLLNSAQQMTGIGEVGEIYFRSPHLAKGYLADAVLTKERFLLNPFTKTPGDRLYRTGDLGRYLPDGNVEFLSRADRQVKIRGFRIELGEIDAALTAHPDVRQAIVILREKNPSEKYLAAYVVPVQGSKLTITELHRYLKEKLPDYMLPSHFITLEALPLTPNGKVDQKALPVPDDSRPNLEQGFVAPRTDIEKKLASIWAEVLKRETVGVNDNFFELGGHSLLAVRLISRMRIAFGVDLLLRSLFESPTIAGYAGRIDEAIRDARQLQQPPLVRTPRHGDLPLSFAQQRLWFLNQLESESAFYNVPIARRLHGRLNIKALHAALESLTLRHEALRTNFAAIDGKPVQVINEQPGVAFSVIDLRHAQDVQVEIERVSSQEAALPFDLSSDPPLRVKLLRLGEDDAVLLITMHHIVTDGWSMEILMRELAAFYEAYSAGTTAQLPELPIQYADYSIWQRQWLESDSLNDQLAYWKKQLHGIPSVFELPKDRPRPPIQSYRGQVRSVELPTALAQQLNEFSRQEGVTLFTTLLAALQTLMWRYTGQVDVVVGTPVANRNQPEIEGLIGFFANTLVLRSDLSGTPTFRELLGRVREVVLNALANQDLPFERLVDELQPERSLSRTPLFQVNFTLQNVRQAVGLNGLQMESISFQKTTSKFDLIMTVVERPNNLGVTVEYNTDLFEDARMERLLGHYQTLLAGIVANPTVKISQLPILTETEREQLLVDWNETASSYRETKYIHELFSEQVERVPGATAVVFGEKQLSYVELNQRANQLASYLRKHGVGAETLVGICVNRSPEMVIAILGVLKAGGAYLPLDPNHPLDLMSYMLDDSEASVLVAEDSLLTKLPETSAQLICLDSDWDEIRKESSDAVQNTVTADNLAYVIYTSGSTGKPRGVMVTHGGLANYLNWSRNTYNVSEGAGSLVHSPLGFDLTVTSLLLPLVAGQRVTLLREEDGIEELGVALSAGVDHSLVKLTPSHMEGLSHLLPRNAAGKTRALVVGGEALFGERISFWRTQAPETKIFNEYGPTETVVGCCVYEVTGEQKTGPVPIGKPIANTNLYVLDNQWELAPVGVPGELYIGGVGVARGYVNSPDLTADKFVPDPFSDGPGRRLYRTGDVVRYLADGNLEYIGRTDHQVKLRGYRIELGEIEAVLNSHPQVREAVVLAREDEPGNKRLVGYIAPQLDGVSLEQTSEFETSQVADWQEVFNESYGNAQPAVDPKFNIVGWNSSYTGEPIPAHEMREWVERTVERILTLEPKRVLEIGCGSGLLLFRIAQHCAKYHGTDLSQAALDYLQKHVGAAGSEFANVTLSCQQRDDLADFEPGAFDLIVLNSVIQYFPSARYLLNLLRDAVRVLRPGGFIFLGDLRSLPLQRILSTSIQLHNAPDDMAVSELRIRIEKQIAQEKELVIDPAFFMDLRKQIPEIGTVDVQLKRADYPNELSKYRYDVTLRVGTRGLPQVRSEVLHWQADRLDLEVLRRLLTEQQPESLIIREVPNGLLRPEFKAARLLDAEDPPKTVRELRKALEVLDGDAGVNPEDIWSFESELPYKVQLRSSGAPAYDSFDVILRRKDAPCAEVLPSVEIAAAEQTVSYTNNPLRAKVEQSLLPSLRQLLKQKLPEHMALSDFVFLPELPLTYNGKIDRSALPAPDQSRSQSEPFEAPRSDIENQLAEIWSEILRRKEVGRNDNFFQLGGHSLLATQVVSRVRERFRIIFPLRRMFEFPTIAEMSVAVRQAQEEGKEQPQLQMRSKRRDTSTLLKNIDSLSAEQIDSLLSEVLRK